LAETKNILLKDIQRKKRRKLIVVNSLAVLGAAMLFTLLGFVNRKQNHTHCWKLDVKIEAQDGHLYLDEKMIVKAANSATDSIVGQPMNEIDIAAIHNKLMENTAIKEAHVYTSVDGRCIVNIKQRSPIARIFNENGDSFYLDKEGFTMATSSLYTPKVPVFVGAINEQMQSMSILERKDDKDFLNASLLDDIYALTTYIAGNEFWSAQVEHIHVNGNREFEIIPRVGNHKINLGKVENLEVKMRKLMAFYANTIQKKDLNQYTTIDVQYDGQVVCVKR
jgi:cell division protein FtsQ